MKQTKTYRAGYNRYESVEVLPVNAMTVAEYCEQRGCTNPYIYKLHKDGKGNFKIVIFKGINFVIPINK